MNMSADKAFDLKVPVHPGSIRELVAGTKPAPGSVIKVTPRSSVVLHFD